MSTTFQEVRLVKAGGWFEFSPEEKQPGNVHVESDRGLLLVMDRVQAETAIANLRRDGWEDE